MCVTNTQQLTKRVAEMSESSTEQPRTILVYRRTHRGDPDNQHKVFGFHDCMGSVRNWKDYDAVIGVGGLKPWPGHEGIQQKITWVGIKPIRRTAGCQDVARMRADHPDFTRFRGPLVTFETFVLWDEKGPSVKPPEKEEGKPTENEDRFPNLYRYMFTEGHIPRAAKATKNDFPLDVYKELEKILARAREAIGAQTEPDTAETAANQVTERNSKPPTSCVEKRS